MHTTHIDRHCFFTACGPPHFVEHSTSLDDVNNFADGLAQKVVSTAAVWVYVYMFVCMCGCMCACVCVCVYVCVYVCVWAGGEECQIKRAICIVSVL